MRFFFLFLVFILAFFRPPLPLASTPLPSPPHPSQNAKSQIFPTSFCFSVQIANLFLFFYANWFFSGEALSKKWGWGDFAQMSLNKNVSFFVIWPPHLWSRIYTLRGWDDKKWHTFILTKYSKIVNKSSLSKMSHLLSFDPSFVKSYIYIGWGGDVMTKNNTFIWRFENCL